MVEIFEPNELMEQSWCVNYCLDSKGYPILEWNSVDGNIIKSIHEIAGGSNIYISGNISVTRPIATKNFIGYFEEGADGFYVKCLDIRDKTVYSHTKKGTSSPYSLVAYDDNTLFDISVNKDGNKELRLIHYKHEHEPLTLFSLSNNDRFSTLRLSISTDGRILIILHRPNEIITDLYIFDPQSRKLQMVYKGNKYLIPKAARWSEDGKNIVCLIRTSRTLKAAIINTMNNEINELNTPPLREIPIWLQDNKRLLLTIDEWPYTRFGLYNIESKEHSQLFDSKQSIYIAPKWHGDNLYFIRTNPNAPLSLYKWNETNKEKPILVSPKQKEFKRIPTEIQLIESDEYKIPCILHRSEKVTDKAIVMLHGGPAGAWETNWSPLVTAWNHKGYNVLLVNPRGSTIPSQPIPPLKKGEFGVEDVSDVSTCVEWLIKEGLATKGKVGLYGHSYGGYLAYKTQQFLKDVIGSIVLTSSYLTPSTITKSKDSMVKRFAEYAFNESELRNPPIILNTNCPILQVHGENDHQLPIELVKEDFNRLVGDQHIFLCLNGENHVFRQKKNMVKWIVAATSFYNSTLS